MVDFKARLARDVRPLLEYRNDVWKCVRCGLCRMIDPAAVEGADYVDNCPSGIIHKFETFYAAGRNELVRCLTADPPELEYTDTLRKAVFTCTGCGHCQITCNRIKGLQPTNAFQALKIFANKKWGVLPEHHGLIQSIINYDNPWMSPRRNRGAWAKKLAHLGIKDASKEKVEVLYFPGCNASYVPEIVPAAKATARILHLAGVDFGILGEKERCCGSTAFRAGAEEMFEKYKRENIQQLNSLGIKTMVTACAGCHSTFSHNYAGELNFEVVHIVEYVDRMIAEGKLSFKKELKIKATYHDPCHIGRYSGIYEPPRNVLKALPGVTFKEMARIKENSLCCGSGGGVKTAYPDMAIAVATLRLEEARQAAGADTVVSCCPFCEINLGHAAAGTGMKVVDLLQLVDEALGD